MGSRCEPDDLRGSQNLRSWPQRPVRGDQRYLLRGNRRYAQLITISRNQRGRMLRHPPFLLSCLAFEQPLGELPSAPVHIDGEKRSTLRGDNIVQQFKDLVEDYVRRRWGAYTN